jgi:hypothetical protein
VALQITSLPSAVVTIGAIAFVCVISFAQRNATKHLVTQTSFGVETPVKHPVNLPKDVLQQLVNQSAEELRTCLKMDGSNEAALPKYFVASAIDINNDGRRDLVVQAGKYCLQGAHVTAFWIFTKGDKDYANYELVFTTHTDWLDVLPTSTNGYRDIREIGHNAVKLFTTVWRFGGQKYRPTDCTIQDALQRRKAIRVRCSKEG